MIDYVIVILLLVMFVRLHHMEKRIKAQGRKYAMAVNEQLAEVLAKIDEATNDIAADLEGLKKKLEEGGVDPLLLQDLDAAATRLQEIAASTENPVPEKP